MQTQQVTRVMRAAWLAVRQLNVPRLGTLCLAATLAIALIGGNAQAQYVISQQGRLLGSGGFAVPPGNHTITVRFWTKSASSVSGDAVVGSALVAANVAVTNGVFTAPLNIDAAQMTALASAATPPAYVSIQVDSDAELTPRIPLADVPFALNARQAFALTCSKCVTGAQIADGTIGTVKIDPNAVFATVGDSAGNAANTFSVANNNNALKFAAGSNATVAFDKTSHTITFDAPQAKGGTVTQIATGAGLTGGPITGSGTISIPTGGVSNTMLANSGITVTTSTGLTGGGTVALGGSLTLTASGVQSVTAQAPLVANGGKSPADISLSAGTAVGQALVWNGTAWSAALIDAAKLASGTIVPIANGGTGLSSSGSSGNFLRSNGSVWASGALTAADLPSLAASYVDKTTDQTAAGIKTWSNLANFAAGIAMTNGTSNLIKFPGTTTLAIGPALNSNGNGSTSTKIVLGPGSGATQTDFAIGVEGTVQSNFFTQWASVPQALATFGFRWYGGTSELMVLKGDGTLTVNGSVTSPNFTATTGAFTGNGSGLTNLNPAQIASGHIPATVIIDGQAATVANGVYTTGSYNNPTWLTGLDASKITGSLALPGNGFSGSLSGDVTGGQATTVVAKIQGKAVAVTAPSVNQVLMWNGTAWTPAAVGSASTTGIATFGTGTLNKHVKWSNTSGALSDSLIYDDGTNVGVNKTTPTALLDVNGTFNAASSVAVGGTAVITQGGSDARANLHYVQATNADGLYLGYNGGGGGIHFYPNSGATETATLSGANMGIGVTAPTTSLQIANQANIGFPSPGATAKGAINIRSTTSGYSSGLTFSSAGSDDAQAGLYVTQNNSAGTTMYLATTGSYAAGPQARVTIAPGGAVGFGNPAPTAAVDVGYTQPINIRTNYIDFHGDNTSSSDRPYFRGNNAHTVFAQRTAGGGTVYFNYPSELTSGTVDTRIQESLYISPTGAAGGGNVGIGAGYSAPAYKLDVSGDIRATGVQYGGSAGNKAFCGSAGCLYDGAASSNSLTLRGQTDSTVGTLYLGSSGAAYLNGSAAGNVGIGVANATAKLQVNGGNAAGVSFSTDGYAQDISGTIQGNLTPAAPWTISSGGVGIFSPNGSGGVREYGDSPYGNRTILWKANTATNAADGGWNTSTFPIDPNKTYRVSVWIKRTGTGGTSYLGCYGSSLNNLDGTANSNPYFHAVGGGSFVANRWYLFVGYIHAAGDASVVHASGIYDGITGTKVIAGTDYKFAAGATVQQQRSYLYYNADAATLQYFWNPRFEEVNGKEQSVIAMVGSAGEGGTANYVPKYDGTATGKVNSQLYDNGTNVGLGTVSPPSKFSVEGDIAAGISSTGTVCWGNGGSGQARTRTETLNDPGTANIRSGFYETTAPSPAVSWYPYASGYQLAISAGYSGNTTSTFHNLQIVGAVGDGDLYYRKTASVGGRNWLKIKASGDRIACQAPFNSMGATASTNFQPTALTAQNYYNTICATFRVAAATYTDAQKVCFGLGGHIMTGTEAYIMATASGVTIPANGDWMGGHSADDTVFIFNADVASGSWNVDTVGTVSGNPSRTYRCIQSSDTSE